MAKVSVNLSEWKATKRTLDKFLRTDQKRMVHRAAEQAGVTFDDFVKEKLPPLVRKQNASKDWTDKQRRWWWATMAAKADGQSNALPGWSAKWRTVNGRKTLVLSGGYRRTGLMVRSLDFDVTQTQAVTTVTYGTNVQHARWVIDLDKQAKYHKGNWPTLQALAAQATALVRQAFADTLFMLTKDSLKD